MYLNGSSAGLTPDELLVKDANGYWTGFVQTAQEGDLYRFYVDGAGSTGFKRDPYARELATDAPFPNCSCIVRAGNAYPWHDSNFVTPDFTNMIVYQAHIGTYAVARPGIASTYLDVIGNSLPVSSRNQRSATAAHRRSRDRSLDGIQRRRSVLSGLSVCGC